MNNSQTYNSRGAMYEQKITVLTDLILNELEDKNYYQFIQNKNLVEKRKFLSLLLLVSMNMSIDELIKLKVNDFMEIIEKINDDLNNYKELDSTNNDEDYEGNDENKNRKYYLTLTINSYGKELNLNLNSKFKHLFKKDLYQEIINNKKNTDPVISSIISNKPLSNVNLKKDINEQIVDLL